MASQSPTKPDPKQVEHAEMLWRNFGVAMKWSVILIVLLMAGLGVVFL